MARLPVKLTPAQLAAYSAAAQQYTPPQPPTPTLPSRPNNRTPNDGGTLGPGSQSVARGVELLRNMRLEDPEAARYFNSRIQTPVTPQVTVMPSMPPPRPMPSPTPRPMPGPGRTPNPFTVDARPIGPGGMNPVPRPGMPGSATGPTPNIGGFPVKDRGTGSTPMPKFVTPNQGGTLGPGMPGSATGTRPNIGGMPGAIMKKGGKVMAKAPVKKAAGGKVAAKPVAKKAGGKVAAKPMGKPVMKKAGGRVAAKPMAKGRKK